MKTLDSITTSMLGRAGKLIGTGAKIGVNYVKYNVSKLVDDEKVAKENLDKNNAEDIYDSLKDLKGSALKVAQMLSMEKNLLPKAYVEKFSLSQFSVPPLSPALVSKSFKKYFGKTPTQVFDVFEINASYAASIGQVHKAEKDGKQFAVKIQYPGIAESVSSDLALVKPIALKMFNIPSKDSDKYFKEVENKLLDETNYELELENAVKISKACKIIQNITFPDYYKELSSDRILTMDWKEGRHLSEMKPNTSQEVKNKIGQALWDFYMYQIHKLKQVHADPHPGNFLVSEKNELVVLDFGCIKELPLDFYTPYFELANPVNLSNTQFFNEKLLELEILKETDTKEEKIFFSDLFSELLGIFTQPFQSEIFDFGNPEFYQQIIDLSEKFANDKSLRKMDGNRGSQHFIYMNRTFFGLYNLLFDLGANGIKTNKYFTF